MKLLTFLRADGFEELRREEVVADVAGVEGQTPVGVTPFCRPEGDLTVLYHLQRETLRSCRSKLVTIFIPQTRNTDFLYQKGTLRKCSDQ